MKRFMRSLGAGMAALGGHLPAGRGTTKKNVQMVEAPEDIKPTYNAVLAALSLVFGVISWVAGLEWQRWLPLAIIGGLTVGMVYAERAFRLDEQEQASLKPVRRGRRTQEEKPMIGKIVLEAILMRPRWLSVLLLAVPIVSSLLFALQVIPLWALIVAVTHIPAALLSARVMFRLKQQLPPEDWNAFWKRIAMSGLVHPAGNAKAIDEIDKRD